MAAHPATMWDHKSSGAEPSSWFTGSKVSLNLGVKERRGGTRGESASPHRAAGSDPPPLSIATSQSMSWIMICIFML